MYSLVLDVTVAWGDAAGGLEYVAKQRKHALYPGITSDVGSVKNKLQNSNKQEVTKMVV